MKKNGFSLVELLAVVAILAIIAIITIPIVIGISRKTKKSGFEKNIKSLVSSAKMYYANNSKNKLQAYTFDLSKQATLTELDIKGKVFDEGTLTINEDGEISIIARQSDLCATKQYDSNEISIDNCTN